MFWLKADADWNIAFISVTFEVFQFPMSWLKADAEENTAYIFVTFEVFQEPMSWLKADAETNIPLISVTFEVFQFAMLGAVVSEEQPLKAKLKVVVPVRSRASVAVMVRLLAPQKYLPLFPSRRGPNFEIFVILLLSPESLNLNPVIVPWMVTV